jgi:FkbH-like protein
MSEPAVRVLLIADFTIDNLAGLLANGSDAPAVRAETTPFGQVAQTLMDGTLACWSPRPEAAVVWTRPEAAVPAFRRLLDGEPVGPEALQQDVDAFADLLRSAAPRARAVLVPSWTLPSHVRGLGMRDLRAPAGVAAALLRMNLRLAERLEGASTIYLLNAQRWLEAAGKRAANPKLWYLGKIAFGHEVFQEAARDIKAALRGVSGAARKLIIVDLDDTLWGGLVGEVGWEQLILGGHDPAGEAFVDFQRVLKTLCRRGIILGIVSKNDEAVALEALRRHPEMRLRPEDFAGWRINWQDKAENIAALAAELNLGLQSVVFIDDHPVERARVREALPEVLVPEWPEDPMLYPSALLRLSCFDAPAASREDLERSRMYATERQRTELKRQVGSVEEWLKTLDLTVAIEPLDDANLARAAQLLNKTNQMNLSTRRLTEPELAAWATAPGRAFWTVRVSDRFGDSGLTGLVSLEPDGDTGRIVDFVLSCRIMGRKVEETMLAAVVRRARAVGLRTVTAHYQPTAKNHPCLEFFQQHSGFSADGASGVFQWDAQREYPVPAHVTATFGAEAQQR